MLDESGVISYIEGQHSLLGRQSPKDQVKYNRIDYLEENVAIEGLKDVLPEAYDGTLTLNEYVNFICNSKLARQYQLVNMEIDWQKVRDGIRKRIDDNVQNGDVREHHFMTISHLEEYSESEKEAYTYIKSARETSFALFEFNRKEYIRFMNEAPNDIFIKMGGKRFNGFDDEMAHVTAEAFKNVDNPTKAHFPGYFEGMWLNYRNSFDIGKDGIEKTEHGFNVLIEDLNHLCDEYADQAFKKKYTETFITVVQQLLSNDEGADE